MTPEAQRIAIAKACGWSKPRRVEGKSYWIPLNASYPDTRIYEQQLPDYLNDLNAMHKVWNEYFGFFSKEWVDAHRALIHVVNKDLGPATTEEEVYYSAAIANATAAQRAEAFLKTIGKWTD